MTKKTVEQLEAEYQQLLSKYIAKTIAECDTIAEISDAFNELYAEYPRAEIFSKYSKAEILASLTEKIDIGAITRTHGLREKVQALMEEDIEYLITKSITREMLIKNIKVIFSKYENPFGDIALNTILDNIHGVFISRANAKLPKLYGLQERAKLIHEVTGEMRAQEIGIGNRTMLAYEIHGSRIYPPQLHRDVRIITGQTDFTQMHEPMANAGGYSKQEVIIIDPSSKRIEETYLKFKNFLTKTLNERNRDSNASNRALSTSDILELLMFYVKMKLPNEYNLKDINSLAHHQKGTTNYVELDEFIDKKTGVCRHHASVMAVLAGKLVQDKLLPFSEVHIYRDNVYDDTTGEKTGAHQIVVIGNKDNTFVLDSLNYDKPVNIPSDGDMEPEDRKAYKEIMADFGKDFADTAANRFQRKF